MMFKMIAASALLAFLGFFSGYNASRKAELSPNSQLEVWLQCHRSIARIIGLSLLLASLASIIFVKGIAAGTLLFLVFLMAVGSLTVLLSPLKIVNLRVAAIAFAVFFAIELFNFV